MIRTAVAVVLAAALSTSAQQESPCAWVSWIKWHSDSISAEQWEIRDALPTRTECRDLNQRLWRVAREQTAGPYVVSVDGVEGVLLTTKYKQGFMTMEYLCLPSSVDPRPR